MRIRKETYRAGIDWLHSLLVAHPCAALGVIIYEKDARGYFADTCSIVPVMGAEVNGCALVLHIGGEGSSTASTLLSMLDEKKPAIVKVSDGEHHNHLAFDIDYICGGIVLAVTQGEKSRKK